MLGGREPDGEASTFRLSFPFINICFARRPRPRASGRAALALRGVLALDARMLRSILGGVAAFLVFLAFVAAYYVAMRSGATWLDGQWLFLAALPYNLTLWRLKGESNFSPDAHATVAFALLYDLALAYLAGAVIEALGRALWRVTRRRPRA